MLELLKELLTAQVACRRQRRLTLRIADGTGKGSPPQIPDTRHYDAGPPGVGKTYLSIALGREAILAGYRMRPPQRRRWSLSSSRRTASDTWTRNCSRWRSQSC
ncbi:ATP-binding protein [Bradyrhizobium sp. 190]|nr:ATP-binding protein [Bradyrhizobium sp. 190]